MARAQEMVSFLLPQKQGKVGTPTIDFRATTGVSERARDNYKFVDAGTAMRLEWETLRNDAIDLESATPGQDCNRRTSC